MNAVSEMATKQSRNYAQRTTDGAIVSAELWHRICKSCILGSTALRDYGTLGFTSHNQQSPQTHPLLPAPHQSLSTYFSPHNIPALD